MPSKDEYPEDAVQACLSVLLELFTYLKSYRNHIVLIGGWVPYFLTEGKAEEPHIGSLDIDLALDARRIPESGYATILALLENRGYRPSRDKNGKITPARYERDAQLPDGRLFPVRKELIGIPFLHRVAKKYTRSSKGLKRGPHAPFDPQPPWGDC